MKRSIYLLLFALIVSGQFTFGQIHQFSQYYASPTILAPSFTGMIPGSRVALSYRDQWPGIKGKFLTYALAYDQYFDKWRSGFGVQALRDQAGDGNLRVTTVGALYSIFFQLPQKWFVRPGIQFMYCERGVDFPDLVFGDQIVDKGGVYEITDHSIEIPPLKRVRYPDVSFSTIGYNSRHWGGLTIDHLIRPNQSLLGGEARLDRKWSFFAGTKFNLNAYGKKFIEESITLSFLYKKQGIYNQLDLGMYWTRTPIVLGLYFRGMPLRFDDRNRYENIDAVILLLGYKYNQLSIGYSYDITVSKLMGASHGSHEVSLIYEFNYDVNINVSKKWAAMPCPRW